jgi:hypothetical protein
MSDAFQSNDHNGAFTTGSAKKRYCLQCGVELLVNAVARDPASTNSDMVPACANCGARNFDTAVESQGINMVLAGRVKFLEIQLEERKRMDAMNRDTAQRAYRLGGDAQNLLVSVIQQRDKLRTALVFLRALAGMFMDDWKETYEQAWKMADEALEYTKKKP